MIIRKLVAGFRAAGLKEGDCVCISSFNDVRQIHEAIRDFGENLISPSCLDYVSYGCIRNNCIRRGFYWYQSRIYTVRTL